MKKFFISMSLCFMLFLNPSKTQADMFGGDLAILAQILIQAIQQLSQLKSLLSTGDETLDLLKEINEGINDSLAMAKTLGVKIDPGIYGGLRQTSDALGMVENIFGRPVDSPLHTVQKNTDETVAEAISFNNELFEYTKNLDKIGEEIKSYSHTVSPGGAAKLTAQSLGVLIHVMNQEVRGTGLGLKLQAQTLALQNKKEKDSTQQYLASGQALRAHMKDADLKFELPRF